MYLAKRFIAPAIHLSINWYFHVTAHQSAIIYLELRLSVKLHQGAGEPFTHSVQHFLHFFISPRFECICHVHYLFSLPFWLLCWLNQSRNMWHGTNILLLWAVRILDASGLLYIGFIVCCTIVKAVIWIIQVAIPVYPILGVCKAFRYAILITLDRMTVDSAASVDIQLLRLSSRKVPGRQSWW